jgi:hypothetical protein
MTDDLDRQKWELLKGLFGVAMSELVLITTLSNQYEQHEIMFRIIAKELEVDLPAPLPPPDPAALERMVRGISELETMFRLESKEPPDVA